MLGRKLFGLVAGLSALAALSVTSPAVADVPQKLVHQGRLFDAAGAPLSKDVDISFALYSAANGGVPVWTEVHTVTVDNGYFSVELGDLNTIKDVFTGAPLFLGIAVGNDAEMTPRSAVQSVPYALLAGNAVGDITPHTISVNGTLLVDANGTWVGPPTNLIGPQGPPGSIGMTGPAGPQGIQGPVGPQGPQGPAGMNGMNGTNGTNGANGAQGPAGPAGPTLQKRATFSFANVPAQGVAPNQFSSITFTPPVSGTAIVTGLGWCNVSGLAAGLTTEVQIGIGTSVATAFNGPVQEWGVIRMPGGLPAGDWAVAWEAQTAVAVTANVTTTVVLAGRHGSGALADDCSGNLQVQVFTGSLP